MLGEKSMLECPGRMPANLNFSRSLSHAETVFHMNVEQLIRGARARSWRPSSSMDQSNSNLPGLLVHRFSETTLMVSSLFTSFPLPPLTGEKTANINKENPAALEGGGGAGKDENFNPLHPFRMDAHRHQCERHARTDGK